MDPIELALNLKVMDSTCPFRSGGPIPEAAALDGQEHFKFVAGKWSSVNVCLLSDQAAAYLDGVLTWATQFQKQGSLNVFVPEALLATALNTLLAHSFNFLEYDRMTHEYVYYKWLHATIVEDRVPESSNTRAGAGALILSPDGTQYLLVREMASAGLWNHVCGTVDRGETSLQAAHREAQEETGLTIDPTKPALFGMGFHLASFHEFNVSDVHMAYVLQATSLELKPDYTEILEARWFTLPEIRILLDEGKLRRSTRVYFSELLLRGRTPRPIIDVNLSIPGQPGIWF